MTVLKGMKEVCKDPAKECISCFSTGKRKLSLVKHNPGMCSTVHTTEIPLFKYYSPNAKLLTIDYTKSIPFLKPTYRTLLALILRLRCTQLT